LARSYAASEGVVALVLEYFHVVSPHESRVFHALTTAGSFYHWLRNA
jgi:hypothetical protein